MEIWNSSLKLNLMLKLGVETRSLSLKLKLEADVWCWPFVRWLLKTYLQEGLPEHRQRQQHLPHYVSYQSLIEKQCLYSKVYKSLLELLPKEVILNNIQKDRTDIVAIWVTSIHMTFIIILAWMYVNVGSKSAWNWVG